MENDVDSRFSVNREVVPGLRLLVSQNMKEDGGDEGTRVLTLETR